MKLHVPMQWTHIVRLKVIFRRMFFCVTPSLHQRSSLIISQNMCGPQVLQVILTKDVIFKFIPLAKIPTFLIPSRHQWKGGLYFLNNANIQLIKIAKQFKVFAFSRRRKIYIFIIQHNIPFKSQSEVSSPHPFPFGRIKKIIRIRRNILIQSIKNWLFRSKTVTCS